MPSLPLLGQTIANRESALNTITYQLYPSYSLFQSPLRGFS